MIDDAENVMKLACLIYCSAEIHAPCLIDTAHAGDVAANISAQHEQGAFITAQYIGNMRFAYGDALDLLPVESGGNLSHARALGHQDFEAKNFLLHPFWLGLGMAWLAPQASAYQ